MIKYVTDHIQTFYGNSDKESYDREDEKRNAISASFIVKFGRVEPSEIKTDWYFSASHHIFFLIS